MELLFNLDICDIYLLTREEIKAIPIVGIMEDENRLSLPIRGYGYAGFDSSKKERTMRLTSPKTGLRAHRHDVRILETKNHKDFSKFGPCLDETVCISFTITGIERETFDENGNIGGDFAKTFMFLSSANIPRNRMADYFQNGTRDIVIAKVSDIEVFEPIDVTTFKKGCRTTDGACAKCEDCKYNTGLTKKTAWCNYIGEDLTKQDVSLCGRNWNPVVLLNRFLPKNLKDAAVVVPEDKFFKEE